MRQIKIRAWDKIEKKWLSFDNGDPIQKDFGGLNALGYWVFFFDFDKDRVALTEFTGIHDKNGKEIYTGDLLRIPPKDAWEKENYVIYEVFFHDNDCADHHIGFQMNRTHYQGALGGTSIFPNFLPKNTTKMEIIGNIYENEELLGG